MIMIMIMIMIHLEVISQYYSPPSNRRERCLNFRPRVTLKITVWLFTSVSMNSNLLLTEREGRTGEYWPEVVAEGQYSSVRLELTWLVSSL